MLSLIIRNLSKVLFLFLVFSHFGLPAFAHPRGFLDPGFSPKSEDGESSRLLTNAARMQAGLGPLKPRQLFNPSRVAAREPSPSSPPTGQCNAGDLQCCQSSGTTSSPVVQLILGLMGISPGSVTGLVGLTCSPLSVSGVGGNSCTAQSLCCTNHAFNGIIALGCTPVNINL